MSQLTQFEDSLQASWPNQAADVLRAAWIHAVLAKIAPLQNKIITLNQYTYRDFTATYNIKTSKCNWN
jgi:hypothetical protein